MICGRVIQWMKQMTRDFLIELFLNVWVLFHAEALTLRWDGIVAIL